MAKVYPLLSELTDKQKGRLAYLIHHKTFVGYITAGRIARGEFGDDLIDEIFRKANMSPHQSKLYANRVQKMR